MVEETFADVSRVTTSRFVVETFVASRRAVSMPVVAVMRVEETSVRFPRAESMEVAAVIRVEETFVIVPPVVASMRVEETFVIAALVPVAVTNERKVAPRVEVAVVPVACWKVRVPPTVR